MLSYDKVEGVRYGRLLHNMCVNVLSIFSSFSHGLSHFHTHITLPLTHIRTHIPSVEAAVPAMDNVKRIENFAFHCSKQRVGRQ